MVWGFSPTDGACPADEQQAATAATSAGPTDAPAARTWEWHEDEDGDMDPPRRGGASTAVAAGGGTAASSSAAPVATRGILKAVPRYAVDAKRSPPRVKKAVSFDSPSNCITEMTPYSKSRLEEWFYTDEDFEEFERDASGKKKRKGNGRRRRGGGAKRPRAAASSPAPLAVTQEEEEEEAADAHAHADASGGVEAMLMLGDDPTLDAENRSSQASSQQQWQLGAPPAKRHQAILSAPSTADPLTAAAASAAAAAAGLRPPTRRGLTRRDGIDPLLDAPESSTASTPPPSAALGEAGGRGGMATRHRESRVAGGGEVSQLGIDDLKAKIRQIASTRRQRLNQQAVA